MKFLTYLIIFIQKKQCWKTLDTIRREIPSLTRMLQMNCRDSNKSVKKFMNNLFLITKKESFKIKLQTFFKLWKWNAEKKRKKNISYALVFVVSPYYDYFLGIIFINFFHIIHFTLLSCHVHCIKILIARIKIHFPNISILCVFYCTNFRNFSWFLF